MRWALGAAPLRPWVCLLLVTLGHSTGCEDDSGLLQVLSSPVEAVELGILNASKAHSAASPKSSPGGFLGRLGDLGRFWLHWIAEPLQAQTILSANVSQSAHHAELTQSLVSLQEHDPTDLAWMTVLLGSLIGLALVGAAWYTFLSPLQKEKPNAEGENAGQGMSEIQLMFNIVKSVVGEGMLSLPAGVAGGTGLLAGSMMTILFAMLMGYTFALMGRVCQATGGRSHKDCCAKVAEPWVAESMAVVLFVKTMFTCLAFAIVISESFARILRFVGVEGIMASSQAALLILTFLVLIPLCLQKQLRILSYTSMIGCFGQVWVVLSMQIRYLDGSYRPGGQFYDSLPKEDQPDFTLGVIYWKTTVASFVLLGSLSTAFIAHYNAPKFYSQLQDATPEKFQKVVFGAFTFAMVIYLWVMAVGYLTFGSNADGLILNNYSEKDVLITTARFAISFAVVFAFPLGFTGLRDSMMSTFEIPEDRFLPVTFGLLSVIVLGACCFHDLGLANSLGGAVLGAMITLIFPGILLYCAGQKQSSDHEEFGPKEMTYGAYGVLVLGAVQLLFGSTVVILKKFFPQVLHL
ncbi:unnamed protein product [Durusdinium trenchii]|uniref:Uncharacterized protein n=2 Tax=Durusdinium trenchii TaxID=1381693 RepID=A0ABP0S4L1_9DINO